MTTTNETGSTEVLHILRGGRAVHMVAADHGYRAECATPVEMVRRVVEGYWRGHARIDCRASVTVGGRVVARAWMTDNGRRLQVHAEAV